MTIVAKKIEMIAIFNEDGIPHPVRFRLKNEDECFQVIRVDRVICKEIEKIAGNKMYLFQCQSVIDGVEKRYEIKYDLFSCKWILWKI